MRSTHRLDRLLTGTACRVGHRHRAARPYSKLPSCAMCRVGRCQGCRRRGVGGAAQPSIVWPSPTRVEQEASRASVSARASPSYRVCVLRSVCLNGDSSSDFESNSARSYCRSVQNLTSSWMARPASREHLVKHSIGRHAGKSRFLSVKAPPRNGPSLCLQL